MKATKNRRPARGGLKLQAIHSSAVQIERFLKEQITGGQLRPGERLPSLQELATGWQVAKNTVQKAMARLIAEGLVVSAPKRGTCVSHEAQKLKIAILSDADLLEESFYFPRALCKQITRDVERLGGNWQCEIYDGLADGNTAALIHDVERNLIKGVIELNGRQTERLGLTALAKLPWARLNQALQPEKQKDPGNYDAALDLYSFGFDAFSHLVDKGFRDIVYFRTLLEDAATAVDIKGIREAARHHDAPLPKVIEVSPFFPPPIHAMEFDELSFQVAQNYLATCRKRKAWPEAVLVSDDVAARAITLAIVKQMPKDRYPYVLTLANEGIQLHYGLPVARYEFSVSKLGATLVAVLKARMTRDTPPAVPIYISGTVKVPKEKPALRRTPRRLAA